MEKDAKIYVAGHRGMVGSAMLRRLEKAGYHNFLTRTSQELDLRNQAAVAEFFAAEKPGYECWPLLRWVVLMPIIPTEPISYTRT
ncbi:MAG: NAD-dependent epimerase/dehydratase family protein [Hymenobacter sp.]